MEEKELSNEELLVWNYYHVGLALINFKKDYRNEINANIKFAEVKIDDRYSLSYFENMDIYYLYETNDKPSSPVKNYKIILTTHNIAKLRDYLAGLNYAC